MAQVEKGEQIGNPRAIAGFEEAEEEARGHHTRPGGCSCLTSGGDTPTCDANGSPDVGRYEFPHEREPFEDDVADIKDRQKPLVCVTRQI